MSKTRFITFDRMALYDKNIKQYILDNCAKIDEPIFTGDIIVDGEIKATNVPHTISETILCTIPAATIQEAINNGTKSLTIDAFTHRTDIIVYANYGGLEYASFTNNSDYIEFFIANPYVTDGFACSFSMGVDADGNTDETKCLFNYRVLDTNNITDLIISQLEISYIDSKYFDHDMTIINSISMNRRGGIGTYSTALGGSCKATGHSSFANGLACEALGDYSTAVGKGSFATGEAGLSNGLMTTAGREAFATGRYSEATGRGSLATGNSTKATGQYSLAEGQSTQATASYSHAEGLGSIATASAAHAEGNYTIAASANQHVEGKYNIEDSATKYAHIVGNGTSTSARSNSHTIDWNGNAWFAGDVYVSSTSGIDQDEGSKKLATEGYVETLYKTLNSNTVLGFYCIEDVTIVTNGISKVYPANSNVEVKFIEGDMFEIVPTSDNSILSLSAFPSALGTFYSWLEGVAQFSNILFDMNEEDMYTKWSQGNQGLYHVQSAQYTNCIFWSDNPYISEVTKRTNYTLTHTSQLPLCYSSIPDNTFKTFYLAGGVVSDPNWANQAYLDSFAKATWATQVFSYYGARTVGLPELSNIALPKDCRGLMFYARNVENAGTFDAANTTTFGAKSGSWRDAFGYCTSLKRLYINNLKVSLNISWSPIDYDSIYYIISEAANTTAITITVSPYTYNLLSSSDFELATSKNITIELLNDNYVEDKRLSDITNLNALVGTDTLSTEASTIIGAINELYTMLINMTEITSTEVENVIE